ncbi:MAG: transposase, partial [Puniceicoccales bacterium]|nr:transposase [Puniceicoccales bacterium]
MPPFISIPGRGRPSKPLCCSLIYLPPYFPDLNPIEKFWANLKGTLS